MTTKPKTPKAQAANGAGVDPVLAAIAEHRALSKETDCLETAMWIARDQAEKRRGKSLEEAALLTSAAEDTWLEYDQFNRAAKVERKAAMRMALTPPTSPGGMAAMISHVRRALKTDRDVAWEEWVPLALKTVAVALVRMAPPKTIALTS
jgi:putative protein kinase ArgK-like GTPase of G3E family